VRDEKPHILAMIPGSDPGMTPAGRGTMRIQFLLVLLLALPGCSKSSPQGEASIVVADGRGFTPNQVSLKQGGVGTIRFQRTSDETCATEVVFPDLNVRKPLPLNQIVEVSVPTTQAKTYAFTCGMGMYKSAVVVN
jgi:plastocyanin domain-containing protein